MLSSYWYLYVTDVYIKCIFMLQHIGYELPSRRMENDLLRLKAGCFSFRSHESSFGRATIIMAVGQNQ